MCVYLIHFATPYKHAAHYIGYADNMKERLQHHRNGTGARLIQVIQLAGIDWKVARTWEGKSRTFERRLKNQKQAPRLCPICNPKAYNRERGTR
jgi:predicted GIY-YIG superfamily endonuclease